TYRLSGRPWGLLRSATAERDKGAGPRLERRTASRPRAGPPGVTSPHPAVRPSVLLDGREDLVAVGDRALLVGDGRVPHAVAGQLLELAAQRVAVPEGHRNQAANHLDALRTGQGLEHDLLELPPNHRPFAEAEGDRVGNKPLASVRLEDLVQGLLQVLFGCHVEPVLLWGGGAAEADDLSGSGDDLGYLSDALVAGANLAVGVRPQLAAADPVGVAAEPVVGDASAVGLAVGHQLERDFVLLVSPRQDLGDGLDLLVGERRHVGAVGVPVGEPGAVVGVLDGDDPVVAVQVRGRAVLGVPRLPDGP